MAATSCASSTTDTSLRRRPLPSVVTPVPTLSNTTRSDGAAAVVSAAKPWQTRCSSAAPAPHPAVPIRTTLAPSSVVSPSCGSTSSGSGGDNGSGMSAPKHCSSHSYPTAAQRAAIRVSSVSICSQLPPTSTSPSRSAVGASSASPMQSAWSHATADSRRRAATLTTPGSAPRRTSGKPKVASVCASTSLVSEYARWAPLAWSNRWTPGSQSCARYQECHFCV